MRTSTRIADSNLKRASDLIGSFKQVAADRAGSRRRRFRMREVVDEVLLTLSPTSGEDGRSTIRVDVPDDLVMDSYPGELGQALTNLVENAALHAFVDRDGGTVFIGAEMAPSGHALIRLRDDGVGMAPAVARRAFDPFFTTTLGTGGTGLWSLTSLAQRRSPTCSAAASPCRPPSAQGATFELLVPLAEPRQPRPEAGA